MSDHFVISEKDLFDLVGNRSTARERLDILSKVYSQNQLRSWIKSDEQHEDRNVQLTKDVAMLEDKEVK